MLSKGPVLLGLISNGRNNKNSVKNLSDQYAIILLQLLKKPSSEVNQK